MEHKEFICPKPWTGVTVTEQENSVAVHVLGRTYTLDGSVLPTSILSKGEELLYAPMRFVCTECGERFVEGDTLERLEEITDRVRNALCAEVAVINYADSVA